MMTKVPVTRPNAATVIAALYSTWAGAWCPQGLKLHSNLKVFSFLILPPPTDRTISGSTCKQGRCKHGPLMAAWLAMSRFVSVGYTPQTTDICVCCQHVDNVDPTHWQHSVKIFFSCWCHVRGDCCQHNHCARRRRILHYGWHMHFWSYQKQRQEKNWEVYGLFCILYFFHCLMPPILHPLRFFIISHYTFHTNIIVKLAAIIFHPVTYLFSWCSCQKPCISWLSQP